MTFTVEWNIASESHTCCCLQFAVASCSCCKKPICMMNLFLGHAACCAHNICMRAINPHVKYCAVIVQLMEVQPMMLIAG